jgi:hypothetical protein
MVDEDRNSRIGRQVALLRGDKMSQAAVAEAMQRRGHAKWSQSTVWAVEKGTRPLRLIEAEDLAAVLGARVDKLLTTPGEIRLAQASDKARGHFDLITHHTYQYLEAVRRLRLDIRAAEAAGELEPDHKWWEVQWLYNEANGRPERAVEIGRFEFEKHWESVNYRYAVVPDSETGEGVDDAK